MENCIVASCSLCYYLLLKPVIYTAVKLKLYQSLPAVMSILDSEDVVSTHSENCLEAKCVHLPEECNQEAAEVEENVPFPQEDVTGSNSLPKTEEISVSKLWKTLCKLRTVLSCVPSNHK